MLRCQRRAPSKFLYRGASVGDGLAQGVRCLECLRIRCTLLCDEADDSGSDAAEGDGRCDRPKEVSSAATELSEEGCEPRGIFSSVLGGIRYCASQASRERVHNVRRGRFEDGACCAHKSARCVGDVLDFFFRLDDSVKGRGGLAELRNSCGSDTAEIRRGAY